MENLKNFYQFKKVLVTGGAGFIGSHLVEKLISLGAEVTVLDNFLSGSISNLKEILTKIKLMYSDIRQPHVCLKATQNKDLVFHAAALVSVPQSISFPNICHEINVEGTRNILEACRKNNVKTVVFSSSCAVYGDKIEPCSEEDSLAPLSPYAQSKLDGEILCKNYAQNYALNTISLRYFNVYGNRQKFNGDSGAVVAKFKHNLETSTPLTIFGTGAQTRDFIHVDEVVDTNIKIAMRTDVSGSIFNVASGKSISILELITKLEKEVGKKATNITFQPARSGDIIYSQANCTKIKQLISSY